MRARALTAVECEARVCIRDGSTFLRHRDAASPVVADLAGRPKIARQRSLSDRRLSVASILRETRGKLMYYPVYLYYTFRSVCSSKEEDPNVDLRQKLM